MTEEINLIDRIIMVLPFVIILLPMLLGMGFLYQHILRAGIAMLPVTIGLVIGIFLITIGLLLLRACLGYIPATPPHVGVVTIHGERKPIIKKEGWHLFWPFFPLWYSVILVNVEKKHKDLHPKDVRSEERAELDVEISITYTPDSKDVKDLNEYINTGGKAGVENILDDIIEEGTIDFAADKGWKVFYESDVREELLISLVKKLTGISDEELKEKVEEVRRGNGVEKIPYLGIVLNRLNIGMRRIKGKLGEEAERVAVEKRQRDAEKVELKHVQVRTKEFQKVGLTPKDALEAVQTERGKVEKKIIEYKGLEGLQGLPIIRLGGEVPSKPKKKKRGS